jgi:gluconokinase
MDRILEELTVATLGGMNTVLACSCLRKKHRDRIRACGCAVRFYFLHADRQRLSARLSSRSGHFFPAGLLDSQLTALEDPREDPDGDVMVLDANLPAAELTALISSGL